MKRELRVAVVGSGHLGRHHARNLAALDGVTLVAVCDPSAERGRAAAEAAGAAWIEDVERLPDDLDAVSIAAPTPLHYALARRFVERGVACLVEKPMTADLAQARALATLVAAAGTLLQVGHVERFNPVLDGLDPAAVEGAYFLADRLAPWTGRSTDTGVVMDLMVHDLDLVSWLANSPVVEVAACGGAVVGPHEDWAAATLRFASGARASLTASRLAPERARRLRVMGGRESLEIDFDRRRLLRGAAPRAGQAPHVETFEGNQDEPLRRELSHFVQCVREQQRPLVSEREGLLAVELATRVLEAIRAG